MDIKKYKLLLTIFLWMHPNINSNSSHQVYISAYAPNYTAKNETLNRTFLKINGVAINSNKTTQLYTPHTLPLLLPAFNNRPESKYRNIQLNGLKKELLNQKKKLAPTRLA